MPDGSLCQGALCHTGQSNNVTQGRGWPHQKDSHVIQSEGALDFSLVFFSLIFLFFLQVMFSLEGWGLWFTWYQSTWSLRSTTGTISQSCLYNEVPIKLSTLRPGRASLVRNTWCILYTSTLEDSFSKKKKKKRHAQIGRQINNRQTIDNIYKYIYREKETSQTAQYQQLDESR